MLTQAQVQRYAVESGLRDIMIAEKEVVLTFLLQLFSERGLLDRLAFKGGMCLRKMHLGSQGRFSTDLDFTGLEDHDHEDVVLQMMEVFQEPFHGIEFEIPDGAYYETDDGLSWGVNPVYTHEWNQSGLSEVKLQISRRETPTLATEMLPQVEQSYFRFLPFAPAHIRCLALPEILAEKIRACYQRNKARDIYDLGCSLRGPSIRIFIRRLVVLKLWQARDSFIPERLFRKFEDGRDFDWDDLRHLLRRTIEIDKDRISARCIEGFRFLGELTPQEQTLANDGYQREQALWSDLKTQLPAAVF
jgi:predicted nucleotidyltransferase component of viral defense system